MNINCHVLNSLFCIQLHVFAAIIMPYFVVCSYLIDIYIYIYTYIYIQGVTGGTDQTSGECSLGQTIPI